MSSLDVVGNCNDEESVRGSNMVQSELNTANPSGPLTYRTYNKDRDRENFAKMVVVRCLPFSFGEHPGFIAYIHETYNPSFQVYLTALLFNPQYKEYGAKALVEWIYMNLDIQPEEEPDLVTCQNSIKYFAKEMYDKYSFLDNVENPQTSTNQVGAHGRVTHKLGLDNSNKCEVVKYLEQGTDDITNDNGIPELLNWWRNRGAKYPKLSRMVKDVLAIQGSSRQLKLKV
uniref:HAT C-terminal dimerisation domain-containing protein n=1 Tax=Solanum lycopersicum TaxID=4081 RepID=A0A3Q7G3I4_SOLLC